MDEPKKSKVLIWVAVLALLLIVAGGSWYYLSTKDDSKETTNDTQNPSSETTSKAWQESGVAVSGTFADPEILDLGNGSYRLYYSAEPEVQDFNGQIYSSISTDGINWTKEDGTRKVQATFPDIIKLPTGMYRMYFQNSRVVKSATSSDGLSWTDEPGIRIEKDETDYNLEDVGATSTTILPDGSYLMVYRGTINQPYKATEKIPNNNTQIYFYATSTDGLTFTKKGLSIDSQNETLLGLADGGELVKWNNELRVYFWSYLGIYYAKYENGRFSTPVFEWTNNKDSQKRFAQNPPGDPTLIKIGKTWFMYYGQHTKGIYYAILK